MNKIFQSKKAILIFSIFAYLSSYAELMWLKNAGTINPEKWQLALFLVPWFLGTIGVMLLIYIKWFSPEAPKSVVKKIAFWALSLGFLIIFGGFCKVFVF